MANRHRADLKLLTLWLPIEYYCQLKKLAAERKQSMSELVEFEIYKMAKNVKLTSEDRKAIDEEIRRNEERGRPPRR